MKVLKKKVVKKNSLNNCSLTDSLKRKKVVSKQPKINLFFELDGKVFLTERDLKDNVVSQEEIDGLTVLNVLRSVLEQSLPSLEKLSKEQPLKTAKRTVCK